MKNLGEWIIILVMLAFTCGVAFASILVTHSRVRHLDVASAQNLQESLQIAAYLFPIGIVIFVLALVFGKKKS